MKKATLLITIVTGLILSGCASNKHIYTADGKCITCWNNPVTGEPINHDGSAHEQPSSEQQDSQVTAASSQTEVKDKFLEHKVSFNVPVNVDKAFIRIKKEFGYHSEQEIRQEWGSLASTKMGTFAYAYDATPSVYYHMRAARGHDGMHFVIDNQIEKEAEKESKITVTFWLRDTVANPNKIGESLKRRVLKALKS